MVDQSYTDIGSFLNERGVQPQHYEEVANEIAKKFSQHPSMQYNAADPYHRDAAWTNVAHKLRRMGYAGAIPKELREIIASDIQSRIQTLKSSEHQMASQAANAEPNPATSAAPSAGQPAVLSDEEDAYDPAVTVKSMTIDPLVSKAKYGPISVTDPTSSDSTCNTCGAQGGVKAINYPTPPFNSVVHMCPNCMKELNDAIYEHRAGTTPYPQNQGSALGPSDMQKAVPPSGSKEKPLPLGNPKYPKGPTVHVAPSKEASTKPPAEDDEYYAYPSGSDRTKDSANKDVATGTRPSGFYQRMSEKLEGGSATDKLLNKLDDLMVKDELQRKLPVHARRARAEAGATLHADPAAIKTGYDRYGQLQGDLDRQAYDARNKAEHRAEKKPTRWDSINEKNVPGDQPAYEVADTALAQPPPPKAFSAKMSKAPITRGEAIILKGQLATLAAQLQQLDSALDTILSVLGAPGEHGPEQGPMSPDMGAEPGLGGPEMPQGPEMGDESGMPPEHVEGDYADDAGMTSEDQDQHMMGEAGGEEPPGGHMGHQDSGVEEIAGQPEYTEDEPTEETDLDAPPLEEAPSEPAPIEGEDADESGADGGGDGAAEQAEEGDASDEEDESPESAPEDDDEEGPLGEVAAEAVGGETGEEDEDESDEEKVEKSFDPALGGADNNEKSCNCADGSCTCVSKGEPSMTPAGEKPAVPDLELKPTKHSDGFNDVIAKAMKAGHDEVTAHKVAYALFSKEFTSCPLCFKARRDYVNPEEYFEVVRKAVVGGILEDGRVANRDYNKFRKELPVFRDAYAKIASSAQVEN
jgi:hypothetical protein